MKRRHSEEAIFSTTLELPPAERAAYLSRVCGQDDALRQRIELLLNASEQSGPFLEQSAVTTRPCSRPVSLSLAEKPGDRIGRYKLLQQLGEGGCGVVYMAAQEEPVQRRVALKVIKLGMDTKQVIARFEAERQALAMMDHPNIAKVLDAGATETGRPYFVMELVRGTKITEYCDQGNLTTCERLGLFLQVCRAVQHAHQKGIIHRDIKPANILVTLHDGVPVPKVIDFGIAKATQGRLADRTVFTAFEQFIGTPAYMSPEQAEMSGLDVDTRSDIYSLGVLLYELLTGRPPFDQKELMAAGLDAMRRAIREQEPERPSTRLSTMLAAELSTTALHRRSDAPRLITAIRGDLDWIVMKCLEKDRTRRYDTANGLASEILRHLNQEPVLACPPSKLYRFQKMVRRNKLAVAAVSGLVLLLTVGLTVSATLLIRERVARMRAVAAEQQSVEQKRRADEQAAIAKAVKDFLQNDLLSQADAYPQAVGGFEPLSNLTIKEALNRASAKIGERFTNQPLVEAEIRETLGAAFVALNAPQMAVPHYEHALALYKQVLGPEDPRTIGTMRKLAGAYGGSKSDQLWEETRKLAESKLGPDDPETLLIMTQIARRLRWSGRIAEGISMQEQTFKRQKAKLGPDHPDSLAGMHWLAVAYNQPDHYKEEVQLREQLLQLTKARVGEDHPSTVWAMGMLAQAFHHVGRFTEAIELAQRALRVAKSRAGSSYDNYPHVGWILLVLGETLEAQGKPSEAESAYREAVAVLKNWGAAYDYNRAEGLQGLAHVLQECHDQSRLPEAESAAREALKLFRQTRGGESGDAAEALDLLGRVLFDEKKFSEAEATFRERLSLLKKPEDDKEAARTLLSIGDMLARQGKVPESELSLREALTLFKKLNASERVVEALVHLGDRLRDKGIEEYDAAYREAQALIEADALAASGAGK